MLSCFWDHAQSILYPQSCQNTSLLCPHMITHYFLTSWTGGTVWFIAYSYNFLREGMVDFDNPLLLISGSHWWVPMKEFLNSESMVLICDFTVPQLLKFPNEVPYQLFQKHLQIQDTWEGSSSKYRWVIQGAKNSAVDWKLPGSSCFETSCKKPIGNRLLGLCPRKGEGEAVDKRDWPGEKGPLWGPVCLLATGVARERGGRVDVGLMS